MILSMLTSHNFTRKPTKRGGSHATKQSWRMQWDCRSKSVTQKRQLNAGRRTSGSSRLLTKNKEPFTRLPPSNHCPPSRRFISDFSNKNFRLCPGSFPQSRVASVASSGRNFPPAIQRSIDCEAPGGPQLAVWLQAQDLREARVHLRAVRQPPIGEPMVALERAAVRRGCQKEAPNVHNLADEDIHGFCRGGTSMTNCWPRKEEARLRDQSNSAGETLRSHKRDRRYISRFMQKRSCCLN